MKKLIALFIGMVLICNNVVTGQCPSGDVVFLNQADVDSWVATNGGCTSITGKLKIGKDRFTSSNINDISGLLGLESVLGSVFIFRCPNLTSLQGLNSLNYIHNSLQIRNNDGLTDISALSNLTTINNGSFIFDLNDLISDLSGLNNLTFIKSGLTVSSNSNLLTLTGLNNLTTVQGSLKIIFNDRLKNLNGLNNLNEIFGEMTISENDSLINLTGLSSLTTVNAFVAINFNNLLPSLNGIQNIDETTINAISIDNSPNLSDCAISNLCDLISSNSSIVSISNNTTGCNSITEVSNNCLTPLPITLTHFQAKIKNHNTQLIWQTASETNNQGFQLQKSNNASSWEDLAFLAGQGTSNSSHDYEYIDTRPKEGFNYYRLKQVDFDGKFEYSEVVSVSFGGKGNDFEVFPNPAREVIFIKNYNNTFTNNNFLEILDVHGKIWKRIELEENTQEVNISDLVAGVYFLKYWDGGDWKVRRLVKE